MEGSRILVLSAREYSIENVNEDTGEKTVNQGISVWYYNAGNLAACVDQYGNKGLVPIKCSLPISAASSIKNVPGWYQSSFSVVAGSNNKASLRLDGLKFLEEFK